jgi:hypothetical protein
MCIQSISRFLAVNTLSKEMVLTAYIHSLIRNLISMPWKEKFDERKLRGG